MSALGRLAGSAVVIGGATLVARTASFARDVALAAAFGAGHDLDLFFAAGMVATFIIGGLMVAVAPATMAEAPGGRPTRAVDGLAALVLLAVLAMLTTGPALILAAGPPAGAGLIVPLSLAIVPAGLGLYLAARLTRAGWRLLPALVPATTPALVGALAFSGIGVALLAWATLAGLCLELAILAQATWRIDRAAFQPVPGLMARLGPLVLGGLVLGCVPLADQVAAASLGPGAVSEVMLGNRLVSLIGSVGLIGLGLALSREFAAAQAADRPLRPLMRQAAGAAALGGFVVAAVGIGWSRDIVALLYQRGAFDAAQTDAVAAVQSAYLLQVPFFLVFLVGSRALAALGRNGQVLYVSLGMATGNAVLNAVLAGPWGAAGIALATSIAFAGAGLAAITLADRAARAEPRP
ncbi:lipid II flippase MurJ [Zavarzinia sp. CC-PAN008]|uniref:lipid II flippase MurJ n=1 Tax=Zavarzinia sp. CC-PAN008 TaxID=3243332 RepID=UPI003F74526C